MSKEKKGFFAEFKEFISRGNVVDMATGVVVATAFTKIVTALTNGIIMPIVNFVVSLFSKGDKKLLATVLNGEPLYVVDTDGIESINTACIYINWSDFIEAIFNFLLVALVIFIIIKAINALHKKNEEFKAAVHKQEIEAKAAEEAKAAAEAQAAAEEAAKAQAIADKEKATNTSTNELLVEVINLLKK